MKALQALAERWRAEAETLSRYGDGRMASVLCTCAADMEAAVRDGDDELVTQDEAARLSGYTTRHLRDIDAAGKLTNHGRKGAPLYRRGELPIKPGHDPAAAEQHARDVLASMKIAS